MSRPLEPDKAIDGLVVMMGGKRVRLIHNPYPEVTVSGDVLHIRDGNKAPAQGDTVQLCVDSRGRHSSVPRDGEKSTTTYADHEVVDVTEERGPDGRRQPRYQVRRKD